MAEGERLEILSDFFNTHPQDKGIIGVPEPLSPPLIEPFQPYIYHL